MKEGALHNASPEEIELYRAKAIDFLRVAKAFVCVIHDGDDIHVVSLSKEERAAIRLLVAAADILMTQGDHE